MKKNITINLFGSLYAIDEDACKLLEQYLDNMKRYFSQREDGDEIVDDIEHRVAEIFTDMRAEGIQAINIDHVRDIIHRIGNPEEMDDETQAAETEMPHAETAEHDTDGESETPHDSTNEVPPQPPFPPTEDTGWFQRIENWLSRRRLFRDPDDMMLGGVTSGLCHFFGANDPLPWRILMVILMVFSFFTAGIIYLIAWALIPQARTAEDRLRMRGIKVTPQSLNDFLIKETQEHASQPPIRPTSVRSLFSALGSLVVLFIKFALFFVFGAPLLFFVGMLGFMFYVLIDTSSSIWLADMFNESFVSAIHSPVFVGSMWIIGISGFIAMFIPLVLLIRTFNHDPEKSPMRRGTRFTLITIGLLSVPVCVVSIICAAIKLNTIEEQEERNIEYQDGYYMSRHDRQSLAKNNWQVKTYENCNDREWLYVSANTFFSEDNNESYLRFIKGPKKTPMRVNMQRTEYFAEGYYRLCVVGYAKSNGAFVYAQPGSGNIVPVEIPTDNAQDNGNLKHLTRHEVSRLSFAPAEIDSTDWNNYIHHRLSGWSYAESVPFYHKGGDITYGITNMPIFVGRSATSASAWNFGVRYIEIVPSAQAPLSATQEPKAAKRKHAVKQQ